jgi:hypothetical protein
MTSKYECLPSGTSSGRSRSAAKEPERRSALRHRGSAAVKRGLHTVTTLCGGDEPQGTEALRLCT